MMQIARLDSESSFFSFFKYCILLFIPMCMSLKMSVVSAPLPKICQFFLVITIAYVNQLFPHCFCLGLYFIQWGNLPWNVSLRVARSCFKQSAKKLVIEFKRVVLRLTQNHACSKHSFTVSWRLCFGIYQGQGGDPPPLGRQSPDWVLSLSTTPSIDAPRSLDSPT